MKMTYDEIEEYLNEVHGFNFARDTNTRNIQIDAVIKTGEYDIELSEQ
jgi:hypothetical protein